jgi:hypothetical protein
VSAYNLYNPTTPDPKATFSRSVQVIFTRNEADPQKVA